MDKIDVDIAQAERIAVLETKVDDLHQSVRELKALLEPMTALYKAGKVVIWLGSAALSFSHWDQIVAFFHQITASPKH